MDIDLLLGILSSGATGVVTYFFTRKQREAEVTSKQIDNAEKILDLYKAALTDTKSYLETNLADMKLQLGEKTKQIYDLNKRLGKVNFQVASLMKFSCMNLQCKNRLTDLRILDLSEKDVKRLNEEELKKE